MNLKMSIRAVPSVRCDVLPAGDGYLQLPIPDAEGIDHDHQYYQPPVAAAAVPSPFGAQFPTGVPAGGIVFSILVWDP